MSRTFLRRWLAYGVALTLACSLARHAHGAETSQNQQAPQDWRMVEVPKAWEGKNDPARGYVWYRAVVVAPTNWESRKLELRVEPLDQAAEVFWNGTSIGSMGTMPPDYRSGLGDLERHPVPPDTTRFGQTNLLALRIYRHGGRSGFNTAAPALFAGDEAIWMRGPWQSRPGDNLAWAASDPGALPPFAKIESSSAVAKNLKRVAAEEGPFTAGESLARLHPAEDLEVRLVLSEPEIGQPVSFKFDAQGRLWVMQYRQYPSPAGLTMVSRDTFLRTIYDRVPPPPPRHFRGQDKITIHEDADGDGRYDRHTTFLDGLNIATSFALGRGGVWVLNPPYLLFYADADQDDRPDGDPEVLLEGFGLEDTHSVANSLRWGPDGWLYAAQGSTVTGHIKRPGSGDKPIQTMGQLIWRYHPVSRAFEVFAEGGGNAFGVEIDALGRVFSGHNGGNTRGFHYVPGGYYQKGFGKHGQLSNPYTFGYFNAMGHHDVPRFTHTFVIYEGTALPERYRGSLLGVEPLQGRVVWSEMTADGSSFKTRDLGYALRSDDTWFRPVDIQIGPDGAVYVADFYEQRIDHASHYQGRVDRGSGRIYRLSAKGAPGWRPADTLAGLSSRDLLPKLTSSNRWVRQTALRVLADRHEPELLPSLIQRVETGKGQHALEALWAVHLCGGWSDTSARKFLEHSNPAVRAWTIRLLCDDGEISAPLLTRLVELAGQEPNVSVRSQMASSAARLSGAPGLAIVRALLMRSEDLGDVHLPLLLWWVVEKRVDTDRSAIMALVREPAVWNSEMFQQHLVARLVRRFAATGAQQDLVDAAALFELARDDSERTRLLRGLEQAYVGRPMTGLPDALSRAVAASSGNSLLLRVRQGEAEAITNALASIVNDKNELAERVQLIEALAKSRQEIAVPPLLRVVSSSRDDVVRKAALSALGSFDRPDVVGELVRRYNDFPGPLRESVQVLAASRRTWALTFMEAVDRNEIDAAGVTPAVRRALLLLDDAPVKGFVEKHWPSAKEPGAEGARHDEERILNVAAVGSGNPYQGRAHYRALCAGCHSLFGEGGRVGPDLTPYQRSDLRGLVANIVDPSAEVREGYENYLVVTKDQRVLNGFLAEESPVIVVLRGLDGENQPVSREQIETFRALPGSLMPAGLLAGLSDQEVRDLLAYLRSGQPLPD